MLTTKKMIVCNSKKLPKKSLSNRLLPLNYLEKNSYQYSIKNFILMFDSLLYACCSALLPKIIHKYKEHIT